MLFDTALALQLLGRNQGLRRRGRFGQAAGDVGEMFLDAARPLLFFKRRSRFRGRRRRLGDAHADIEEVLLDPPHAFFLLGRNDRLDLNRRRRRRGRGRSDARLGFVDPALQRLQGRIERGGAIGHRDTHRFRIAREETFQPDAKVVELLRPFGNRRRAFQAFGHFRHAFVEGTDSGPDLVGLVARLRRRRLGFAPSDGADAGTQPLDGRAGGFIGIVDFAGELIDHRGDALQRAGAALVARATVGDGAEVALDLVDAVLQARNGGARILVHGANALGQLGDSPGDGVQLIVAVGLVIHIGRTRDGSFFGNALGDRLIEPFVEGETGLAGGFDSRVLGLVIEILYTPSLAGFHFARTPMPRRVGPSQNRPPSPFQARVGRESLPARHGMTVRSSW